MGCLTPLRTRGVEVALRARQRDAGLGVLAHAAYLFARAPYARAERRLHATTFGASVHEGKGDSQHRRNAWQVRRIRTQGSASGQPRRAP